MLPRWMRGTYAADKGGRRAVNTSDTYESNKKSESELLTQWEGEEQGRGKKMESGVIECRLISGSSCL